MFHRMKKGEERNEFNPFVCRFFCHKKISSNIANIHYTATSFVWFLYYWYKRSSLYQILPTTYRCKELESLKRYQIFNYSTIIHLIQTTTHDLMLKHNNTYNVSFTALGIRVAWWDTHFIMILLLLLQFWVVSYLQCVIG